MKHSHRPALSSAGTNSGHRLGTLPVFAAVEITLIVLLFFVLAGTPAPEVNESHYLAKAKHYWNPQWCAGDLFLESADAHWTFYWTFGWLTQFMSLTAVAWIGRFLTWGLLAWAWYRLSNAIAPGPWYSVLSAALFATLIRWGHMAGEWIIGGVEAKGFAYALMLLALEALVRDRWRRAAILCGVSAAFHVLVGGWALVGLGIVWLLTRHSERPPLRELWPTLLLSVVLSLPGVLPGLTLNWSTDPATIREGTRIYVFERLAHHLVFHKLSHLFIARHAALMVTFVLLWRWLAKRNEPIAFPAGLARFVAAAMVIAVIGALLDQLLLFHKQLSATILRYYWFRMSDVMTPLGVTLALVVLQQRMSAMGRKAALPLLASLLLVVTADVLYTVIEHRRDPRPGAVAQAYPAEELPTAERIRRWHTWLEISQWVTENTSPTDLFLTPRYQQTFKWDADRPEVVNGKDFPQDAASIVAWRRRMDDIFPYTVRFADLVAHGERRLLELSRKYGFRYIVVDRSISTRALTFPRVYPLDQNSRSVYEVYRVPNP